MFFKSHDIVFPSKVGNLICGFTENDSVEGDILWILIKFA